MEHVEVYRREGEFAGWPANHGIWSWGDEVLIGFLVGRYQDSGRFHAMDFSAPQRIVFARTLDGGHSWSIEESAGKHGMASGCIPGRHNTGTLTVECPGVLDFTADGFACLFCRANNGAGPSHFHLSGDRGRTWSVPYRLPDYSLAARTSYVVDGPAQMTAFVTRAKANGREGESICIRTVDGGQSWQVHSLVHAPVDAMGFSIMPSVCRIDEVYIAVTRNQVPTLWLPSTNSLVRRHSFLYLWRSDDDARTWRRIGALDFRERVSSSPASVFTLPDGRLCVVSASREGPYDIHAYLGWDGEPRVLCDDGASHDIGYPVACMLPGGSVLTAYYWHDGKRPERYVRATIWEP